jgi:hypothetical protein
MKTKCIYRAARTEYLCIIQFNWVLCFSSNHILFHYGISWAIGILICGNDAVIVTKYNSLFFPSI